MHIVEHTNNFFHQESLPSIDYTLIVVAKSRSKNLSVSLYYFWDPPFMFPVLLNVDCNTLPFHFGHRLVLIIAERMRILMFTVN